MPLWLTIAISTAEEKNADGLMERTFVDTSGWVALFVENDLYHKQAKSIFEDLKGSKAPLYTSDYVIDETITTILGRGNHYQSVLA